MAAVQDHVQDAYIKINGFAFPVKDHEGEQELEPGSEVITNALEGFAPSTVAGDATVVDQQSVAVLAFTNFTPGQGFKFSDEAENIGGYAHGNLDTRYPNMAVLPPKRIDLGALPAGFVLNANPRIMYSQVYVDQLYVWNYASFGFAVRPASGVWINRALPAGHNALYGVVEFGGTTFGITDLGVISSPNPATTAWTAGWLGTFRGPVIHDNKLYLLNLTDGKMYWSTFALAGGAGAWANSSTATLIRNGSNENVFELYEFVNRANSPVIHITTERRIVAYDDDDFFADFYRTQGYQVTGLPAEAAVWEQDRQVYRAASAEGGTYVLALTDDTSSNVSVNKRGGLSPDRRPRIRNLSSSLNYLYAYGGFPEQEGFIGDTGFTPDAGLSLPWNVLGWVLAWNGEGWHVVAEGKGNTLATGRIFGVGYAPNQILWLAQSGGVDHLWTAYTPEFGNLPYDTDMRQYVEGTFYLRSAIIDANHENVDKTARHVTLYIEKQDNTPGLPTDHTAQFWASWNGGTFFQYGPTLTSADTFPYRIPFPGPNTTPLTLDQQQGIVWRQMQWEVRITKLPGAPMQSTPIFRGLGLGYVLSPDVFLGFQFVVDLTKERFKQYKGGTYKGYSRGFLRNKLYEMTQGAGAKNHYRIEWGWADQFDVASNFGQRKGIIPAAEIRLNTRENPGTGFGEYTITGKDVSVKAISSTPTTPG